MKLTNAFSFLAGLLLLSSCTSQPDYTLNSPASSEWVTVLVKLPPETEVVPIDVLYRSEKCQREVYDEKTESHISMDRAKNPRLVRMIQQGRSNIWKSRIALNGGGKCEWKLSAIRIDIQPVKNVPMVAGKSIIPTSYVFGFDDEAYGGGEGSGRKKEVRGDLILKTQLFPMITYHRDNEVTVKLFGGDTDYEKWSRHHRIYDAKKIVIEPVVYLTKVVTLTPPEILPGDIIATYPDGSAAIIEGNYPDYEKLLLMR